MLLVEHIYTTYNHGLHQSNPKVIQHVSKVDLAAIQVPDITKAWL